MSADYSGLETVFAVAMPQIWDQIFPDVAWHRSVSVTKDAEDNFKITQAKVLIHPRVFSEQLDIAGFCKRIAEAVNHFDHLESLRDEAIRTEWEGKLTHIVEEIAKRFGSTVLEEMISDALITAHTRPDFAVREFAISPILPQPCRPEWTPPPGTKEPSHAR